MLETLAVRPEIAELVRVGEWVVSLSRKYHLTSRMSFAIQLCLEEAISNVVRHGFPVGCAATAAPAGTISVTLRLEQASKVVIVTVEDEGIVFNPLELATPVAPRDLIEAPVGGLGIHLMRRFVQHLTYEWRNGHNLLTLCFDASEKNE